MQNKPIRSPSYPSLSLEEAVNAIEKIEEKYRGSAVDREVAAGLIGYSTLSGPANKTLAALAAYGLLERAGKGMARVTTRARTILHPQDEGERRQELVAAALEPRLFRDIKDRFPDIDVPPEEGVRSYLNREGFNPSAVSAAVKSFVKTMRYIESLRESESHGDDENEAAKSELPDTETGGAAIGDHVQWVQGGAPQFNAPRRVRWVSGDGTRIAVDGDERAIPVSEVIVAHDAPSASPPEMPPPLRANPEQVKEADKGFNEWFRAKVGPDKLVTINFKGEGNIGPREIEKMIRVLEAQKLALED
ncbi:MAG: hypothetical protein AAFW01_00145 [Pseudomonadota bacterium]